jgi:hypothetical protein
MNTTKIELSYPTNRTIEGPKLSQFRDSMVVEYDCQQDDGSVVWARIAFAEVLASEYRQISCCTEDSIVGFREIRVANQSSWLSGILHRWSESVGWQDWQKQQGGASRFKHFTIFFDDACCMSVVARSCDPG